MEEDKLTPAMAHLLYTLFEYQFRVLPSQRWTFVKYITNREQGEFRINGTLGHGGKFYKNLKTACPWYVDMYPEDQTDEQIDHIVRVNDALGQLFEHGLEHPQTHYLICTMCRPQN